MQTNRALKNKIKRTRKEYRVALKEWRSAVWIGHRNKATALANRLDFLRDEIASLEATLYQETE